MTTCIEVLAYGHPGSHPPSIITQDSDNRFVTDAQITDWTNMAIHTTIVSGNPHQVTAAEVGLGNNDNTSDADKPVSIAQQAALDLKVDLADYNVHTHNLLRNAADTITGLTVDSAGDVLLRNGVSINEFSTDGTLGGDSDDAVPTERAVKQYIDNEIAAYRPTEMTSPDGTPAIALSIDASGRMSLVNGPGVDRITDDTTLAGNSPLALPTESAVKGYVDTLQAAFVGFRLRTPDSSIMNALEIDNSGRAFFPNGVGITRFSADNTLASASDDYVPTEKAVKEYVDNRVNGITQTLNFGVGASGDVATMTVVNGVITGVTLAP